MIFKLNDIVKIKATGKIGKIVNLIESYPLSGGVRTRDMIVVQLLNERSPKMYFANGDPENYVEHIIADDLFEI
ncbi:MAG: hypothetical protein KAR20_02670 [Candidatus Heimdallarchaeota archaeon]|nr:hypothetical protein [Candidatus Heimdallarchaeota archaeon]